VLQLLQWRRRLPRLLELLHGSLLGHSLPFHARRCGRQVRRAPLLLLLLRPPPTWLEVWLRSRPLLGRPLLERLLLLELHWLQQLLLLLLRGPVLLLPRLHRLELLLHLLLSRGHAETRHRQHHPKLGAVGARDLDQLQR